MVLVGEVEVGQRVGLGVLEQLRGLRADAGHLLAGQAVELADERGVVLGEHRAQDGEHGRPLAPRRAARGGVALEVDDAALPGRPRERLLDGAPEALVGVGGDAGDARDAALAQAPQEGEPTVVALGVDRAHAEQPAVAVGAAADGRDERAGRYVPAVAALDVGGVEPHVGPAHARQVAPAQVVDRAVEGLADARHLAGAHGAYAHGLGDPGDLAGADAVGDHLGDRRDHGVVGAGVAGEQVLWEVADGAQLGDAQADLADARDERSLPIAVPAVSLGAGVLGLRVHDLVHERLRHRADELAEVDHPVVEPGHLGEAGGGVF